MRPQPVRRFTLADVMVLVAATALAVAWVRSYLMDLTYSESVPELIDTLRSTAARRYVEALPVLMIGATPLLVSWTATCLIFRLVGPRPRLARLRRQPGFIACLALCASALLGAMVLTSLASLDALPRLANRGDFRSPENFYLVVLTPVVGVVVMVAWIGLVLSRRWKAEPSWIDRFGRGLGITWILCLPLWFWARFILLR